MNTSTKTPVDIIQELLAVLSTRKEAAEKLMGRTDDGELTALLETSRVQSDKFIEPLMGSCLILVTLCRVRPQGKMSFN